MIYPLRAPTVLVLILLAVAGAVALRSRKSENPAGFSPADPAHRLETDSPRHSEEIRPPPPNGAGEREAPPQPSTEHEARKTVFVLTGVSQAACRGKVTTYYKNSQVALMDVVGSEVVVSSVDVRRVEFIVAGYCIAEYAGPLDRERIEVPLIRAGTVVVEVKDSTGRLLPDRLVYCFPLKERESTSTILYRTTPWGYTDAMGRATIENVLPGQYRVDTGAMAEWLEGTTRDVQVYASGVTSCLLDVPVLEQDEFGGFAMKVADPDFIKTTRAGVVKFYAFVAADGKTYTIYRIGQSMRCVVPGSLGARVTGRIRQTSGAPQPEMESGDIEITIGAVRNVDVTWSKVAGSGR
jgi:hypothetical protein